MRNVVIFVRLFGCGVVDVGYVRVGGIIIADCDGVCDVVSIYGVSIFDGTRIFIVIDCFHSLVGAHIWCDFW